VLKPTASPGGSSGQIQWNSSGSFAGAAALTYATSGTHLTATAQAATDVTAGFVAHGSQSANLTEWRTSAGTVRGRVLSSGRFSHPFGNVSGNECFGTGSGRDAATGGNNTCLGANAGAAITSGTLNTFVGGNAGAAHQGAWQCTYVGYNCGSTAKGDSNTLVGYNCGSGLVGNGGSSGWGNTAVGASISFSSGSVNNMAFGNEAVVSGNDNILFGANAAVPSGFTQRVVVFHMGTTTGSAGMKPDVLFTGKSSTTNNVPMLWVEPVWVDSTHASRKCRGIHYAYDTAARECFRIEASGTAAMIGFFGAAAIARPTLAADATDLASVIALANDIKAKLSAAAGGLGLCA